MPDFASARSAASCEPSSCTSDQPLDTGRVGHERRRASVGTHCDTQADRRERRRLRREIGKYSERLVARGLEKVRSQIDRRPLRQRPALVGGGSAEARLELRREPFRKITRDMRRRAGEIGGREARPFGVGKRRWRVPLAREQRRNGLDIKAARLPQRAQDFGARRRLAHDPADELLRRSAS
jgi:hypothetical protein